MHTVASKSVPIYLWQWLY